MTCTYRGVTIFRNTTPGYRLPYTALTAHGQLSADTLAGIKGLIREKLSRHRTSSGVPRLKRPRFTAS